MINVLATPEREGNSIAVMLACKLRYALLFVLFLPLKTLGQENLTDSLQPMLLEASQLYALQFADIHASYDFFKDHQEIKGWRGFPYKDGNNYKVVFYLPGKFPRVFGTVTYDEYCNANTIDIDRTARHFTRKEKRIYHMVIKTEERVLGDTSFKSIDSSYAVLTPLVMKNLRKVYLTYRSVNQDEMIFGNDCAVEFNTKNEITTINRLHATHYHHQIIKTTNTDEPIFGIHFHENETKHGFSTTDIALILLCEPMCHWSEFVLDDDQDIFFFNLKEFAITKWTKTAFKREYDNKPYHGKMLLTPTL